jgi:phenylacetate-coenzyme A ligase PaaK-like adenylate-forming protein
VEEKGMRELVLRLELTPEGHAGGAGDTLEERVVDELRRQLSLSSQVEVLPPGTIPRTPGKAYRFKVEG